MEQAKSNYNLRNKVVNQEHGKPASIFIKENGPKCPNKKEIKNKGEPKVKITKTNHDTSRS